MGKLSVYHCYRLEDDYLPTPMTPLWSHRRKHAMKSALFKLVMHDIVISVFSDAFTHIEIVTITTLQYNTVY